MKQTNRKRGFSLIELIVVIAVIAAIAAVIVPSVSNFNSEARRTSDQRNVQLWTQTYLEAKAAGALANIPAGNTASHAPAFDVVTVDVPVIRFTAPEFDMKSGATMTWGTNTGATFVDAVAP